MGQHVVYILASQRNGTLYIGVTTGLKRRVWEHKNKAVPGFTSRYGVGTLVYYEVYEEYWTAANRERCLKEWRRRWKLDLIEASNPQWKDLYEAL